MPRAPRLRRAWTNTISRIELVAQIPIPGAIRSCARHRLAILADMPQRRRVLAIGCLILVPGSIVVTLTPALYIRSGAYRRSTEQALGRLLDAELAIGSIRPLSLSDREFSDVEVTIAPTAEKVFYCKRATWKATQGSQAGDHLLILEDGWLMVGTADWTPEQYRQLLGSGLGHDFFSLGLGEVRLEDIDIRFSTSAADLSAGSTSGVILFEPNGLGRASLNCDELNGVAATEPINIAATFTPGAQFALHQVRLNIPSIPMHAICPPGLLGGTGQVDGTFRGRIEINRDSDQEHIEISGYIKGANLIDFSWRWPTGPFGGRIDVQLDSITFDNRKLSTLVGRAAVAGLRLDEMVPALGTTGIKQTLDLSIAQLHWQDGQIKLFESRNGRANVELERVASLIGVGKITGTLRVQIHSLLIVDDILQYADVELRAEPSPDHPGLIHRSIIAAAAKRYLSVDPSMLLPEHVEYARLGVRLRYERGELAVLGTHGDGNRTMLTVRIFGREVGLLHQPAQSFAVADPLPAIKQALSSVDRNKLRQWWKHFVEMVAQDSNP